MAKRFYSIFLVLLIITFLAIYNLFIIFLSEIPPGCIKSFYPGGCLARNKIKNVGIYPPLFCVDLKTYNCNGPYVTLTNKCNSELIFNTEEIKPNQTKILYGYKPKWPGDLPIEDKFYEYMIFYNNKTYIFNFTLTKAFC